MGENVSGLQIAYETWGELSREGTNAVLMCATVSHGCHAKSNEDNPERGWYEKFIGPGASLDSNEFFIICVSNLGGCHGSSGPSDTNPDTGEAYGLDFPTVTIWDIVETQFLLLDYLGISKLHAVLGASMGGMSSLAAVKLFPHRINRMVTISAALRSPAATLGVTHLQRTAIMSDPAWQEGSYASQGRVPTDDMSLARQIGMVYFRGGPEWFSRFGRNREKRHAGQRQFQIEGYLDHHGGKFAQTFDANSYMYLTKAMDLFDLEQHNLLTNKKGHSLTDIICPVLVVGIKTDKFFPVEAQRQIATALTNSGNPNVTYLELDSSYGHDCFLLDTDNVGASIKGFLIALNHQERKLHTH